MPASAAIFALEIGFYDSKPGGPDADNVVTPTPCLTLYPSTDAAAAANEGLTIVEGDIWFYAADGAPMEADFSEEPYINNEKNTYFPGVYKLVPGEGETLQQVLAEETPAHAPPPVGIVVYVPSTDDYARGCGWMDAKTMNVSISAALHFLPKDLLKRVRFEARPAV